MIADVVTLKTERHGCIVCGKTHSMDVLYDSSGHMRTCNVTSLGAHRVFDLQRPLVACDTHTLSEEALACSKRSPGGPADDEPDD